MQEINDQEKLQKESSEMNNDFGDLDITESKHTLFLPLETCQSTLQGSSSCALGKKGNVKEK